MYLKVFVTPGAKHERIEEKGETLTIMVKEPATGNRANKRVREIVALRFGRTLAEIRIFTGHRSRTKILSIHE